MKVIRVSNYDHEDHRGNQRVVKGGLSLEEAERLVKELNSDPKRSYHDWFRAVPEDEKLFVFDP